MRRTYFCVFAVLAFSGCLLGQPKGDQAGAPAANSAAVQTSAAPAATSAPAPAAAPVKPAPAPAPKPEVKAPPQKQLSLEEVQYRRTLEKELDRDLENYYGLVKDRNVESAMECSEEPNREAVQKNLWAFNALYSVETWDITSKKIDFETRPFKAEVNVSMTVYEQRSVTPKKLPSTSRWKYGNGHWFVQP